MANEFEPKTESRLLLNEDLQLAKQITALSKELLERRQVLADKANKEWEDVCAAVLPEIKALQDALFSSHGITEADPEYPLWRLDSKYLEEHDLLFLVKDVEAAKDNAMVEQYFGGKTQH